jgi:hypothetical protein
MTDATQPREVVFENLKSRLKTSSMLESDPPALRVNGIEWDSGFRGSGLQIGDQILQPLDAVATVVPPEVQELARLRNSEFRAFVRERIKRQMEALLRSIEDLKCMLEPSGVERDFSREELERMLR